MKILFDHSIFLHQKFGGISKYIINLNSQLNKKKNIFNFLSIKHQSLPKVSKSKF